MRALVAIPAAAKRRAGTVRRSGAAFLHAIPDSASGTLGDGAGTWLALRDYGEGPRNDP